MNKKKFFISWLAYIIITFAVAASWHLAAFKSIYDQLGIFTRKEPIIALGLVSMILQGAVMAYLYPLFYRSGSPMRRGLLFGLLMGIFMGSNAVFAEAGKNSVSSLPTWLILESVYYIFQFSLVGIIIGLIHGRKET